MPNSRQWSANGSARPRCIVGMLVVLLVAFSVQPTPVLADEVASDLTRAQRLARLQAMTAEQRVQFGQRLAAWNALSAAEREERRARFQAWQQLDANERSSLRALAAQVDAFPPERKHALRAQFDGLEDVQRHGWRLGPALGRDFASLHPLLAYVPAPQRRPLLARLRSMDEQQRTDLAVLAQRTPPQERQTLRSELLSLPPSDVAAWLRRKLIQ